MLTPYHVAPDDEFLVMLVLNYQRWMCGFKHSVVAKSRWMLNRALHNLGKPLLGWWWWNGRLSRGLWWMWIFD